MSSMICSTRWAQVHHHEKSIWSAKISIAICIRMRLKTENLAEFNKVIPKLCPGWSPCDVQKSTSNRPVASVVSQFSFPHNGLCKTAPGNVMQQMIHQGGTFPTFHC